MKGLPTSPRVLVPDMQYLRLILGPDCITAIVCIKRGINKAEDASTAHGQISSTDALQRVFPTTVSRYLECGGLICQETLCD